MVERLCDILRFAILCIFPVSQSVRLQYSSNCQYFRPLTTLVKVNYFSLSLSQFFLDCYCTVEIHMACVLVLFGFWFICIFNYVLALFFLLPLFICCLFIIPHFFLHFVILNIFL